LSAQETPNLAYFVYIRHSPNFMRPELNQAQWQVFFEKGLGGFVKTNTLVVD
jgi:hypothetical protein